jgi:hypothetical protein
VKQMSRTTLGTARPEPKAIIVRLPTLGQVSWSPVTHVCVLALIATGCVSNTRDLVSIIAVSGIHELCSALRDIRSR